MSPRGLKNTAPFPGNKISDIGDDRLFERVGTFKHCNRVRTMADSLLAARTLLDTDRLIRGRVTSVLKIPRIADRIGVRRKRRAAVALGGAARVNPDD